MVSTIPTSNFQQHRGWQLLLLVICITTTTVFANVKFFTFNVFANDLIMKVCAYKPTTHTQFCFSTFTLDYAYYITLSYTSITVNSFYNLTVSAYLAPTTDDGGPNQLIGTMTYPGNITSYNFLLLAYIKGYSTSTATRRLGLGGYSGPNDPTAVSVFIGNFFYPSSGSNTASTVASSEYNTYVYDTSTNSINESTLTIPSITFAPNTYQITTLCNTSFIENNDDNMNTTAPDGCYMYTPSFKWSWTYPRISYAVTGTKSLINANAGQMLIYMGYGYFLQSSTGSSTYYSVSNVAFLVPPLDMYPPTSAPTVQIPHTETTLSQGSVFGVCIATVIGFCLLYVILKLAFIQYAKKRKEEIANENAAIERLEISSPIPRRPAPLPTYTTNPSNDRDVGITTAPGVMKTNAFDDIDY